MKATLIALGVALAPALAVAGPKEEASKHIEAATKAHSEEKFDVALVELEAAYKLDPDPELLYAIGQVHSKLGHCSEASAFYERYQQTNKDAQVKAVIDEAVASCQPSKPPDPDPLPVQPPPPAQDHTPLWRAKLPYIVGGAGALTGLIGMLVYLDARSDLDAAEKSSTLPEYEGLVDDAKSKRTVSVVLVVGGAAMIGAGVALYVMREKRAESSGVTIAPITDGGMITWSGTFR